MSDRLLRPRPQAAEPERFRRRQFVAPHRRRRLIFRLVRPFLVALAIVGAPSLAVAWVLLSDQFVVREVLVESTGRVSSAWVEERLQGFRGRHLFSVDVAQVKRALDEHRWIHGVLIRKLPPGGLEVRIQEKQPVALLSQAGELVFVDASGAVIAPFDPSGDPSTDTSDFVLLSAPDGRPELIGNALALVEQWRRRKLPWAEGLSEVAALTATDFRAITANLPCPIYVSSHNLSGGLASLVRYGSQIEPRLTRLGAIDLRFRGRIVFQPAAEKLHNLEGKTNA